MSSEWIETDWGSIATLEYGKGLRDYRSGGGAYPVYGTNGQVGHCESFLCPHAGIVVGRKGAYRGIHYSANPFYVIDTAYWLKPKIDLDLKWAYYELLRQDINSLDSGSAIPSTTRDAFYSLDVFLPPIEEQKEIAHILGTLDDKIELNRKTNETLEAMAKALFKSWFVDFDPVRAKAEGRPTGLPAEISDLFPVSFEDSELGEIPSGWKVMELGMVSTFLNGYAFKSVDWQDNGVPVVKIGSVKPGFVDVEKVSFVSDEIASSKRRYRISPGDILIGMTGAYIGEFGLVPHSENPPLLNQRVGKVTQLEGGFISRFFLYNWMTNSSFKEKIKMLSHGSAQENISSETIQSICLTIPTKDVASAFDLLGQPIIDDLLINNSEQIIISGLRDTLLPKLISGEIRIPDAERMLEEVGI